MGVRTIYDRDQGIACMFDSVTGTAFGPVFSDYSVRDLDAYDQIASFHKFVEPNDARQFSDNALRDLYRQWVDWARVTEHAELM